MAGITQYRQKDTIFIVVSNERTISQISSFKSRVHLRVLGKWKGGGGVYTPFLPWTKMLNVSRTAGSFLVKLWQCYLLGKFSQKHFATPKSK